MFAKDIKVLVIGDVILDTYTEGQVTRICPEAPVPVFVKSKTESTLGGAGNVARNLCTLGAKKVWLVGVIGEGKETQKALAKVHEEFPDVFIPEVVIEHGHTTTKHRYIAQDQILYRVDDDRTEEAATLVAYRLEVISKILGSGEPDVVVLSDYGKGFAAQVAKAVIKYANYMGIPVVVDPKSRNWKMYHGATVICPNEKEFRSAIDATGIDWIVETKGDQGIVLHYQIRRQIPSHYPGHYPAWEVMWEVMEFPQEKTMAVDVTGAGDVVTAVVAMSIVKIDQVRSGYRGAVRAEYRVAAKLSDMENACKLANRAAGIAVAKPRCATVYRKELEQIELEQIESKKIVVANGVFDCLHAGHIHLLKEARKLGPLIVLVNRVVPRALQDFETRSENIACLKFVDSVMAFDTEDELQDLMNKINPDYVVKGSDYKQQDVTHGPNSEVVIIEELRIKGIPLHSSVIRKGLDAYRTDGQT